MIMMDRAEVLARRLQTQRVATPAADPLGVITDLTCVQSQEYAHALWSVGLRSGATEPELSAAFDRGDILRTHILRPTWHLVTPADAGWILALTGPRVRQRCGPNLRRHGLDDSIMDAMATTMISAVERHGPRTRSQLAEALAEAGTPATGDRLAHVIIGAEQRALLISGPMVGAQHSYVRFADRVPVTTTPEDPEAELCRRFFAGHGPAGVDDCARWSSLTKTVIKAALTRLGDRLAAVQCEGTTLWFDPNRPYDPAPGPDTTAWLLPLFDELTLSYPTLNFPAAEDHPHPPGPELFVGSVILGRHNVGIWKRVLTDSTVAVSSTLAPGLTRIGRQAVEAAEEALVDFLRRRRVGQ